MKTFKRIISSVLALSLITGAYAPAVSTGVYSTSIQAMAESSKSYDDFVVEIRQHFLKRDTEFTLEIPNELFSGFDDLRNMIADACNETDNPVGGDYLRWTAGKISYSAAFSGSTANITVTASYRTTAEQEAELDEKVAEILASLDFGSGSDYDKAKAVYDYVAENVKYNINAGDLKYSAYGAGVQGEAVCEGYSLLLYRLLMELGIKCRVLSGDAGGPHAWNMAEIDGVYYLMDVTFDSTINAKEYYYFLKGIKDFDSVKDDTVHTFDVSDLEALGSPFHYDYYKNGDFLSRFNISETAYDPLNPPATTKTTNTTTTTAADTETVKTTTTTATAAESEPELVNKNMTVNMYVGETYTFEPEWKSESRPYDFHDFDKVKYGGSSGLVNNFDSLTATFTPTSSGWLSVSFYDYSGNIAQYTVIVSEPEKNGIIDDSKIHLLNNNPSVGMVGEKVFLFWHIDDYTDTKLYSITSDNKDVATANAYDGITLVGEGTAEIEIVFEGKSDGKTCYATKYLTVQAVPYVETTTVSTVTTKKSSVTTKKTTATTTTAATGTVTSSLNPEATLLGDANCDGLLTIADATAIVQHLGNLDEYGLSEQGKINADCYNTGDGVTGRDAVSIQKIEAGLLESLPETE